MLGDFSKRGCEPFCHRAMVRRTGGSSYARGGGCYGTMAAMFHEHIGTQLVPPEPHFRWRGGEITRVEGFSDAVFAFAITLLVVSLEVPRTFHELAQTLRGFVVFGVCFTLLIVVWHEHYVFFRRYGLQDSATIWLNAALLFVMLFYVYPLKF